MWSTKWYSNSTDHREKGKGHIRIERWMTEDGVGGGLKAFTEFNLVA